MGTPPVNLTYALLSTDPTTHRANFSLQIRGVTTPTVELALPVWAPGAYEIRESAREVRELTARRPGAAGPLPVERIRKNRWRVDADGASEVEVLFTIYGHDLIDDGMDVDGDHSYLNATRCFPWVVGRENEPIELVLHHPPGWRAFVELPRIGENPPRFRAPDFEALVDAPIDIGTPEVLTIRPGGIPHNIVICGGPGNYEIHKLETDVAKIVEAHLRYFGSSPLTSYTFFLHLSDRRDGGLEHKNSTSLIVERNSFRPAEAYDRILTLFAHEYFHLYNVKRIRPKVLGPFDFDRENYTRQLWWMEGTTDYVSAHLLRRAGLWSPARYLTHLGEKAKQLADMPGRQIRSLEEASFVTWVDLYRKYEETRNQSVDYYTKGHLISACLDLEIRGRTENRKSLDDLFRLLWDEYSRTGRGLEEGELEQVAAKATGLDLADFFRRYIRGTEEPPLAEAARYAGLTFGPAPKPPANGSENPEPAYLGVEVRPDSGRAKIAEVLDGTPARRAGLTPGDEIVAFDGTRVLFDGFTDALKRYAPGDAIVVDLFRRGVLKRVTVTTGTPPPAKFAFTPVAEPTERQKQIYASWLEAPWEPAKPTTAPTPP